MAYQVMQLAGGFPDPTRCQRAKRGSVIGCIIVKPPEALPPPPAPPEIKFPVDWPRQPHARGVHDGILPARYLAQGMTAVPPMAYVAETEPGTGSI